MIHIFLNTIINELQRVGYESYGNEVLYDGLTGQQIETSNNEPISYGFSSASYMGYDDPIQSMSNLVSVDSSNSINAPDET